MHRIDSHHHLWDLTVRPQTWQVGNKFDPVRRNFDISDLKSAISDTGITHTYLVQTVMNYDETPELLVTANENEIILGVTGWLKIDSPDAIENLARYEELPGAKYLKGIRDIAHDYPDPNYLAKPQVIANCKELGKQDYVYELLTKTEQMKAAIELVKSAPNTLFVLDHISKPLIATGELEPWATHIRTLAKFENLYCKVSGMITEAKWKNWKPSDYRPYFEIVIENFGADRIMYGSDWPVALLSGTYKDVYDLAEYLTNSLSESEKQKFWCDNAKKVFDLEVNS